MYYALHGKLSQARVSYGSRDMKGFSEINDHLFWTYPSGINTALLVWITLHITTTTASCIVEITRDANRISTRPFPSFARYFRKMTEMAIDVLTEMTE